MDGAAVAEQRHFFGPEQTVAAHDNGMITESDHQATWLQASGYSILYSSEWAANDAII